MHSREIQIEQNRALANERLSAAVTQSREIAEETARVRAIHKKINSTLAERDIEWEKKQWFTQNIEALRAWAESGGKLPSVKSLDTSDYELRVLKVALDQIATKLLVLSAQEHMSLSEELECESRLAHLAALEAHFKAEEFLRSGAEILGEEANVDVNNSTAEILQFEADQLLTRSNAERERSLELVKSLKGGR